MDSFLFFIDVFVPHWKRQRWFKRPTLSLSITLCVGLVTRRQVRKVGSAYSRVKMSAMWSRYSVQRLYSFAFYAHRERLCDVTFKAKLAVENNSRNALHIQFTPTSNALFIVKISAWGTVQSCMGFLKQTFMHFEVLHQQQHCYFRLLRLHGVYKTKTHLLAPHGHLWS